MRITLVTGTDTGVGKTVVTAALRLEVDRQGKRVVVVKPAQTGVEADEPGDAQEVTRLSGVTAVEAVRLRHPLPPRPPPASRAPPSPISRPSADLILSQDADHVLVEGAGGILVNLGHGWNSARPRHHLPCRGRSRDRRDRCSHGLAWYADR